MKFGILGILYIVGYLSTFYPSVSSLVMNMSASSLFPSNRLTIVWMPNGKIIKYLISVGNANTNKCLVKVGISCSDCKDNITNVAEPHIDTIECNELKGYTFSSRNSTFAVKINDQRIKAYKEYRINIYPLTEYGWGNMSSLMYKTSPYESGPVSLLIYTSSYRTNSFNISWFSPKSPNGEIFQYIVTILNRAVNQCVLRISMNCTDCTNKNMNVTWPNNDIAGCNSINGRTFKKSDNNFILSVNNSRLQPYTRYQIFVFPINEYGFGESESLSIISAEYKSEPVSNLMVSSSFPSSPLSISWSVPLVPNGKITNYLILVENVNAGSCLLKLWSNCSDCGFARLYEAWPYNNKIDCDLINLSPFDMKNLSFFAVITNSRIKPYTNYRVIVAPVNRYGFGNFISTTIRTSQYLSEAVSNLSATSLFPSNPLSIVWLAPLNPNGEIIKYLISVGNVNTNKCLLKIVINCSDCTNNIANAPEPNNETIGCTELKGSKFCSKNHTFSIVINDQQIKSYKDYKINVYPLNGYGWGHMSSIVLKTSPNCG